MGGKYEIRGFEYPFKGYYDLVEYTDSWWEARKFYRKAKKMFYSAFIVRNDKKKKEPIAFTESGWHTTVEIEK